MMMYEHPNIRKSYQFSNILGDKVVKKAKKNCWGCCDKISLVSKKGLKNWTCFRKCTFCHNTPKYQKTDLKSEIMKF